MKRIHWDLEEAVALYDLYFKSGQTLSMVLNRKLYPSDDCKLYYPI